jgi:type I restriction enzyme S subunit
MTVDQVPDGWKVMQLGDVGRWGSGGTPKRGVARYFGGDIPWVKSGDLHDGAVTSVEECITMDGLRSSSAKLVDPGTLLIAMYGATIGRLGVPSMQCATNQAIAFCAPDPSIVTTDYLFELLLHMRPELIALGKGGAQPNISQTVLKALEVPIPPLAVQGAVVHVLRQTHTHVTTASDHLEVGARVIERFRRAVLAAACSGRLTADWRRNHAVGSAKELISRVAEERRAAIGRRFKDELPTVTDDLRQLPESWAWATPGSLCEPERVITYGVIKLGPPTEDGVPTLRSSDVRWLRIDNSSVKRISRQIADNYKRTYLRGGEVLVTVRGTLGGVAVATPEMAGWNVSREVAVIPLSQHVDAEYCMLCIGSMHTQRWLGGVAKGVAYTGVNIEDLRKLPLPVPPIEEQRQIVKQARAMLNIANELTIRINSAIRRVEISEQAILAKAFRGELMGVRDTIVGLAESEL